MMLRKYTDNVNDVENSNIVPFKPVDGVVGVSKQGVIVKADLDDGYLRLSNTLVDSLCLTKLSDRESRVLFSVMRRTYGFGKPVDWISYSQIQEMTAIDSNNVSRVVGALIKRNILLKEGKKIGINTVISGWLDKPISNKTVSLDSNQSMSKQTVKPVNLDCETVSLDNKPCQSRPPQKKDINTKERQKEICAKSSFNAFFKQYPSHRKGGSDSAAWAAWKSEKLTDQDCEAAIDWLALAAQRDSNWGISANGQFVLGVTKFIRNKTWLTPLPTPATNNQRKSLQIPVYDEKVNEYSDYADDFNMEI
ncbi:replication protein [Shewanella sp. H8]|uniref:replication protein n=1 Tax=Shewanella sp. H8 TaxID=3342676 RepID=UPI003314B15A